MLFCFLKNAFHAANQNEDFFHSYSQNPKDISNRCYFFNNHFVAKDSKQFTSTESVVLLQYFSTPWTWYHSLVQQTLPWPLQASELHWLLLLTYKWSEILDLKKASTAWVSSRHSSLLHQFLLAAPGPTCWKRIGHNLRRIPFVCQEIPVWRVR